MFAGEIRDDDVVDYDFGDFKVKHSARVHKHLRRIERQINRMDRKVSKFEKESLGKDQVVRGAVQLHEDLKGQFREVAESLDKVGNQISDRKDGHGGAKNE
jgi:hypothetical protein